MGTTVIPSGTAAPNWSRVPSSSSRGTPSVITCWASRITTGSAHAPPIQPCRSPEAVMIAREPCWPEDGACRQTTVASANGWPRRVSSPASSSTSKLCISNSPQTPTLAVPYSVRAYRGRPGDVVPLGDRLPDPVGEQWHVDVADPGLGQRVQHRVHERGRAADRRALPDALGADRVVRAGGDHLAVQLEARRLPG